MCDPISDKLGRSKDGPLKIIRRAVQLRKQWRALCHEFLPVYEEGSLWCYSRGWLRSDPHQGWKIHISATIHSACEMLDSAAPYLRGRGILFKAVTTLDELAKLNSGLWYGYSQIGKFITVYPLDEDQFQRTICDLEQLLPADVAAPRIPFDLETTAGSNIFYRYGGFVTRTLVAENGTEVPAILSPSGKLIADRRDIPAPEWVSSPIVRKTIAKDRKAGSPLSSRYKVFSAHSQRGKGGVYEAFDTSFGPPVTCIIKEGRLHGETAWDGRDGRDRVENEAKVLADLLQKGVNVPHVFDHFEVDDNSYLVLEKISGTSLQRFVKDQNRLLTYKNAIEIGRKIAQLIARIHAAGWVWRDCKPTNLFVTNSGKLRPIDFEGACRIDQPDRLPWNTPNFSPPEIFDVKRLKTLSSNIAEDLFALGTVLYYIFEGKLPPSNDGRHPDASLRRVNNRERTADDHENFCISFSRRGTPASVKSVITRLLGEDPDARPVASEVFEILSSIKCHFAKKVRKTHVVADRIE